jgi:hypothetical protein
MVSAGLNEGIGRREDKIIFSDAAIIHQRLVIRRYHLESFVHENSPEQLLMKRGVLMFVRPRRAFDWPISAEESGFVRRASAAAGLGLL